MEQPINKNDHTNWLRRLAGEVVPIIDGEPDYGFYRIKRQDGIEVPCAYWYNERGELRCRINGQNVPEQTAREQWPHASKRPVAHEWYEAVVAGGNWPDLDSGVVDSKAPGIGDNSGNSGLDDAGMLRQQIEAATANAPEYETIDSDDKQARAQSARARLLELSREAVNKHTVEKRPHLDAGKAVDQKWNPLRDMAKTAADRIARAMGAWEDKKRRAAEAKRREAEEAARRAAEEAAKEAAKKAAKSKKPVEPAPPLQPVAEQTFSPPPPTKIKGGYGRAASVQVVKVAKIVDQDAVYQAFREYPEVKDLLQKLAQTAVKNGHTVPGTEILDESKVR